MFVFECKSLVNVISEQLDFVERSLLVIAPFELAVGIAFWNPYGTRRGYTNVVTFAKSLI